MAAKESTYDQKQEWADILKATTVRYGIIKLNIHDKCTSYTGFCIKLCRDTIASVIVSLPEPRGGQREEGSGVEAGKGSIAI